MTRDEAVEYAKQLAQQAATHLTVATKSPLGTGDYFPVEEAVACLEVAGVILTSHANVSEARITGLFGQRLVNALYEGDMPEETTH